MPLIPPPETVAETAQVDAFFQGKSNSVTYKAKVSGSLVTVTLTRP